MILVKTHSEEELLLKLISEFASKVILPRNFSPNETFKKYAAVGVFGITGVEKENNEVIFMVELPPSYVRYIEWEVDRLRNFVQLNEAKPQGENIRA